MTNANHEKIMYKLGEVHEGITRIDNHLEQLNGQTAKNSTAITELEKDLHPIKKLFWIIASVITTTLIGAILILILK